MMVLKWKRELVLDYYKKGMRPNDILKAAKSVNINNSMVSSEEEEVGGKEKIKFSLPSSSPARQLHGSDIKFRKFKIDKI